MIRQAISCDICGAEKKQTNHWFVACEQAGELRVSGWSSRNRLRAGTKHLCGQTCLHKLVDEFMARAIAGRVPAAAAEQAPAALAEVDASLTSLAAYADPDASRGQTPTPATPEPSRVIAPALVAARPATVVSMPSRPLAENPASCAGPVPMDDAPPAYSSRRWRAEAWERERNRELRAVERHPDILRRRNGF